MIRAGLVIAACVVLVSGCAFVDNPTTGVAVQAENSVAAVETVSTVNETEAPITKPVAVVPPRSLAADEIRRMQVRLRDVGLEAGPVDGVAGGKTKAAAKRFQLGCAEVRGLIDGSEGSALHALAFNKVPNRQDTLVMQQQLRNAGFNPGPADGIFGAKMKTIFTHLQNGCPVVQEFVALMDQSADNSAKLPAQVNLPERPSATRAMAAQSRQEAAKQLAQPVSIRPQEDVRILQLRLRDAGYDPGPFDGIMGPKTKLALQQMQANQRSAKAKTTVTARAGTQY